MKTLLAAAVVLALVLPAAARAQDSIPTFHASMTDTLKLKITRINTPDRIVTLKDAHGDTLQVECGPEIRNFDKLRVNDMVQTVYKEDLSIRVDPTGSFTETTEKSSTRAAKGAAPAAQFWEKKEVSAKITEVNTAAGYAVIQTKRGEEFTVLPDSPENLSKVQPGNFVVVTQTVTSAISVSKPMTIKQTNKKTTTKTKTTTTTKKK